MKSSFSLNNRYCTARNSLEINIALVTLQAKSGRNGKESNCCLVFFKVMVILPDKIFAKIGQT